MIRGFSLFFAALVLAGAIGFASGRLRGSGG